MRATGSASTGAEGARSGPKPAYPIVTPMVLDDEWCVAQERSRGAGGARRAGPEQLKEGGQRQSESTQGAGWESGFVLVFDMFGLWPLRAAAHGLPGLGLGVSGEGQVGCQPACEQNLRA